jgi:hypothetical protein
VSRPFSIYPPGSWVNDKKEGSGKYFFVNKGKVLVGMWADDIPVCGVYEQCGVNPQLAENIIETTVVPVLDSDASNLLSEGLTHHRALRAKYLAKTLPVHRLYGAGEIKSLRMAFECAATTTSGMSLLDLKAALETLNLLFDEGSLRKTLSELQVESDSHFTFETFMRVIAILRAPLLPTSN